MSVNVTYLAAALAGTSSLFSIGGVVYATITRRAGKDSGDSLTLSAHGDILTKHGAAIESLQASQSEVNKSLAVLQDIERRREESDRRKEDKLDKLAAGQAEILGRMSARGRT